MKRKITLIEILAIIIVLIIGILFIFRIIVSRKNNKDVFYYEVLDIYKEVNQKYVYIKGTEKTPTDFYIGKVNNSACHMEVYGEKKIGNGSDFFAYIDVYGRMQEFVVSNGKYQYVHKGELKAEDINIDDIEKIDGNNKININCEGVF